jgi:hypothetical protein
VVKEKSAVAEEFVEREGGETTGGIRRKELKDVLLGNVADELSPETGSVVVHAAVDVDAVADVDVVVDVGDVEIAILAGPAEP